MSEEVTKSAEPSNVVPLAQPKAAKKPASKPKAKPKAKKSNPKKITAKKPVKKASKPVKKAKGKKERVKPIGPGTKQFKFKDGPKVRGACDILKCGKKGKWTGFRCPEHKKKVRKAQLKANNQTWFKRIDNGTAKHHAVYTSPKTGKLMATKWARLNPDRAKAYVKADQSIVSYSDFLKILAASNKAASAKVAKKSAAKKAKRKAA